MKIKVMSIIGTRPEAIKMAPVVKKLELDERFESVVVVTGQHRQMLDQVLDIFKIIPDYDLNIMKVGQTLSEITVRVIEKLDKIMKEVSPDIVLVHGDTTTTFAASIVSFYNQTKIGHVEAGLRTWDKYSPFPEEMNRQMTDVLADMYFAPTMLSKNNLIKENVLPKKIYVTGNTAIDAMKYTVHENYSHTLLDNKYKNILITMHRRENIGKPMIEVYNAINKLIQEHGDIQVIFPIHKNPIVRELADKHLISSDRVKVIEPLDVVDFQNFANNSYLILTDSGGVQEEAPSLGVPVVVLRDTTERPEGIQAGTLLLTGTEEEKVYSTTKLLLEDEMVYNKMAESANPYGDGNSSERIIEAIAFEFGVTTNRPMDFKG